MNVNGRDKSHGGVFSRVAKATSHKFTKDKRSKKIHPSDLTASEPSRNHHHQREQHSEHNAQPSTVASATGGLPQTQESNHHEREQEFSDSFDQINPPQFNRPSRKFKERNNSEIRFSQEIDNEMPSFRAPRRKSRSNSSFLCKSVADNEPLPAVSEVLEEKPKGPRSYGLGEAGKKEDMIIHRCFEEKLVAIAQLKEFDHAFVWRSNGDWTYAVVVARSGGPDAYLKFVVDESGHTKQIPLRQWSKFLRLAKPSVPAFKADDNNKGVGDSQADTLAAEFLSSTNAINGEETDVEKLQAEMGDMHTSVKSSFNRPNFKEDQRRRSESFLHHHAASNKRGVNRRSKDLIHPYESKSTSHITQGIDDAKSSSCPYHDEPKSAAAQRLRNSRPILRRSLGQRFSEIDGSKLRVSFRLSTVEPDIPEDEPGGSAGLGSPVGEGVDEEQPEQLNFSTFERGKRRSGVQGDNSCSTSANSFDVKFNQRAFLSALSSINEKSRGGFEKTRNSFVTVDAM